MSGVEHNSILLPAPAALSIEIVLRLESTHSTARAARANWSGLMVLKEVFRLIGPSVLPQIGGTARNQIMARKGWAPLATAPRLEGGRKETELAKCAGESGEGGLSFSSFLVSPSIGINLVA